MLTVREIMTPGAVTIAPDATIGDAIELLLGRGISGLPVVDRNGALVGILTEFALLALAYDQAIANESVASHMTRDVLTVEPTDAVSRVADLCVVHRVRRVPVTQSGRLVGLVTRRDVLRALCQPQPGVAAASAG
ncbi:CBS domain-containing protein [Botrimarina sp.]|uniref:CBS domain-containing protein n=1 Tax=Botrimarina sp. TaxID=2795802 RepID=UPI0032F08638